MNSQRFAASGSYHCSVDSARNEAWDRIVATFSDGVIDQTWSYGSACWGSDRLSNLVLRHNDDLVAACQLVIFRPPMLAGGVAHVKFGPLWQSADGSGVDHVEEMLRCLRSVYVEERGMFLRIMPQASVNHPEELANRLTNLGFSRRVIPESERYIVNTSSSEDQLRAGLKSKWRYNLKKAEQQDLTVEHGTAEPILREFLDIYDAMRTRKTFADSRSKKHLLEISENLPSSLKAKVWLCRKGSRPVAGAVVSRIGDTAFYLFGATDELGRELRAGYLLHWSIINSLRSEGCKWYDLGGGCGNQGLTQFKSGLTGANGTTASLPGQFDLSGDALSTVVARSAFRLQDYLRSARKRLKRSRAG